MKRRALRAVAFVSLLVAAIVGVGSTRRHLGELAHRGKQRDDVYVLPPPRELRIASLGYRAAVADLLWASLLVENGLQWSEKRPFSALTQYLDGILALDPEFAPVFRFADTLLLLRYPRGTEGDARLAREYLERGLAARPHDHDVWMQYGQFLAFLAPSYLTSKDEIDRWRREGAEAIAKAVELGADVDRSLPAAMLLNRSGETQAAVRHLRRAYALSDDPAMRAEIAAQLVRLEARAEVDASQRSIDVIETNWRKNFPFLSRGEFLSIGPPRDAAACAGPIAALTPQCAPHWNAE